MLTSAMPGIVAKPQAGDIVKIVSECLSGAARPVALHEPRFNGREREYVLDCIETTWVSYAGAYVGKFEQALARLCGVTDAIAVSNGTVALQLALELSGMQRGDEVLTPALTFVASANAVVHAGGIPHFVDVSEEAFGVDPVALRTYLSSMAERRGAQCFNRSTGRRISTILVVHIFGHPVDMDSIADVAREFSLEVIEDAAESLGSRYKGKPCGSLSRLAALSFNGNKIVTTGGGGAILTSDARIAERARSLVTTAKRQHRWAFFHDEVAYNFRLPNINAALGLAQVEQLEAALAAKAVVWRRYRDAFSDYRGARIFEDAAFAASNHWLVALLLEAEDLALRNEILDTLNDAGIGARAAWTPMHELPMYRDNPRAPLPVTESLAARIINLPSSQHLA